MFTVIPTSSAFHLARRMESGGFTVVFPAPNKDGAYRFPDGESYLCLPEVEGLSGRIVVLHSGAPDPNGGIAELELLLSLLRRNANASVEACFTYFPYGMQDHSFRPGEANAAADLLQKLSSYYGVRKIYAIDPHFSDHEWMKQYPFAVLPGFPLLQDAARREFGELVFVAPDKGSQKRANLAGLSKTRQDSYTVEFGHDEAFAASVKGRNVAIVDDLVETGGTLVKCIERCREYGASKVVALVTHGVLPAGLERVGKAADKLFISNTIDRPEAEVDVTELILGALK